LIDVNGVYSFTNLNKDLSIFESQYRVVSHSLSYVLISVVTHLGAKLSRLTLTPCVKCNKGEPEIINFDEQNFLLMKTFLKLFGEVYYSGCDTRRSLINRLNWLLLP